MKIKCVYNLQSGVEYVIEANTISEIQKVLKELQNSK